VTLPIAARYERDPEVVSREIAGEQILVPIKKKAADMAAIYVLNETGARIWDLVDGQRSLAEIRDHLVQEYDVEPDVAGADLEEMVGQLQEMGMLRAVEHAV
jgi:hypothetical protein